MIIEEKEKKRLEINTLWESIKKWANETQNKWKEGKKLWWVEINEVNKYGNINKSQRRFFENFNKVNKLSGELIKEKRGRTVTNNDSYHHTSCSHLKDNKGIM